MSMGKRPFRGPGHYLPRLLALLIFLFISLAEVYNYFVPPFEGPDEAQHFAYVLWLAQGKGFPPQGAAAWKTSMEQEASQPPLYYFLAALPIRLTGWGDGENPAVYRPNPHYPAPFPHQLPDNENRAIHYPTDTRPLQGEWLAFYLARTVTLLFGGVLLLAVYGLARQVLPTFPHLALGATALVAFTPQVLFLSTLVSNDIPAAAFSTLTLYGLFVWLKQRPTSAFWPAVGTGVALGLASLTKVSALLLGLPVLVGWGWWGWQHRAVGWRVWVAGLGWMAGVTAVAGWWFGRNWWLFGSPIGLETHDLAPWALTQSGQLAHPVARWVEVLHSYWLALGWGAIRPDDWVYTGLSVCVLLALVGLGRFAWQSRRPVASPEGPPLALLGILWLTVLALAAFLELWMRRVVAPHGRLLFPAIAAIAVLLVFGWYKLHRKLPLLVYVYFWGWSAITPWYLLQPAYQPALLTRAEITAVSPRLGWLVWEEGEGDATPLVEILRVEPGQDTAVAGDILPVEICWQAQNSTNRDYTFMLQLIGPANGLAAARRTYPGHGLIPTSTWQPGDAACERLHVKIPPELSQTLVYHVEFSLIDAATDTRLRMTNATGDPLTAPFVAQIRLQTRQTAYTPLEAAADHPIHLLAANFDPLWLAGESAGLTLHWATMQPLAQNYQVFVHLRLEGSGVVQAQADGPPLQGWYPTSWWTAGEIVTDARTVTLPADLPDGRYHLVVGFYDLESGTRLGRENDLGLITVVGEGG